MPESILCAVDLQDPLNEVAAFARRYAKMSGATVDVVYVTHPGGLISELVSRKMALALKEQVQEAAEDGLNAFLAVAFPDIPAEGHVLAGNPAEAIVQFAREKQSSCIIMGTHGRKGMDRMMYGSVAGNVIASAGEIPVITMSVASEE